MMIVSLLSDANLSHQTQSLIHQLYSFLSHIVGLSSTEQHFCIRCFFLNLFIVVSMINISLDSRSIDRTSLKVWYRIIIRQCWIEKITFFISIHKHKRNRKTKKKDRIEILLTYWEYDSLLD